LVAEDCRIDYLNATKVTSPECGVATLVAEDGEIDHIYATKVASPRKYGAATSVAERNREQHIVNAIEIASPGAVTSVAERNKERYIVNATKVASPIILAAKNKGAIYA